MKKLIIVVFILLNTYVPSYSYSNSVKDKKNISCDYYIDENKNNNVVFNMFGFYYCKVTPNVLCIYYKGNVSCVNN